ncbi:MAG: alpha-ketoacid dehydrogenase subunit beta [Chloroflexi bacterium]|nr:alpha-ketoacid dehydrogenase subunit beta [Chloroflexota bacterium]
MAIKTNLQAVRDTLMEIMERYDNVVVMGEDVGPRGGVFQATRGLYDRFGPDRVIDTPLAELSIVAVAIGMALNGYHPIAEIQFADFIFPAFNQIVNEAARYRYRSNGAWPVPLIIRAPYGGGVSGGLYHSQSVEAFFTHVPGLYVLAPSTPKDIVGLLRAAVQVPDPVLFFEHKRLYGLVKGEVPDDYYEIRLGEADIKRRGDDITVVAYGLALHEAIKAADKLSEQEGIEAEIIDLRSLVPLDLDTIYESLRKTGKILIVHEDNQTGGWGAEIAARIAEEMFDWLDAPVMRLGGPDVPAVPYAPPLERWFLPLADKIAGKMRELAEY